MSSETTASVIGSYRIGPKIRELRKKKNLSLVRLGEHTGTSAGLLSKIERGRLVPTLATLHRIAMVFGVGLDHFFRGDDAELPAAVVRKADRLQLPNSTDGSAPSYVFESLDFPVTNRKMNAYFATFKHRTKPTEPHAHAGAEFIYVVSGSLVVTIDGKETKLDAGDSMYLESSHSHSYRQDGKQTCRAVVVVSN